MWVGFNSISNRQNLVYESFNKVHLVYESFNKVHWTVKLAVKLTAILTTLNTTLNTLKIYWRYKDRENFIKQNFDHGQLISKIVPSGKMPVVEGDPDKINWAKMKETSNFTYLLVQKFEITEAGKRVPKIEKDKYHYYTLMVLGQNAINILFKAMHEYKNLRNINEEKYRDMFKESLGGLFQLNPFSGGTISTEEILTRSIIFYPFRGGIQALDKNNHPEKKTKDSGIRLTGFGKDGSLTKDAEGLFTEKDRNLEDRDDVLLKHLLGIMKKCGDFAPSVTIDKSVNLKILESILLHFCIYVKNVFGEEAIKRIFPINTKDIFGHGYNKSGDQLMETLRTMPDDKDYFQGALFFLKKSGHESIKEIKQGFTSEYKDCLKPVIDYQDKSNENEEEKAEQEFSDDLPDLILNESESEFEEENTRVSISSPKREAEPIKQRISKLKFDNTSKKMKEKHEKDGDSTLASFQQNLAKTSARSVFQEAGTKLSVMNEQFNKEFDQFHKYSEVTDYPQQTVLSKALHNVPHNHSPNDYDSNLQNNNDYNGDNGDYNI